MSSSFQGIGLLTKIWLKMKKIMAWIILAKKIWTKQIKKTKSVNLRKLMDVELWKRLQTVLSN